jgi:hypothetical protein
LLDDPTTTEDDWDRAHFALGFAAAIPRFILSAFGEIFGSTWAWRGLEDAEASAAAEALLAARGGGSAKEAFRRLGPRSAARVAHALLKLGYVKPGGGLRLSLDGQKFLKDALR